MMKISCLGWGRGGREQRGRGRPHSENTSTEVRSLPWLAPPPATTITKQQNFGNPSGMMNDKILYR